MKNLILLTGILFGLNASADDLNIKGKYKMISGYSQSSIEFLVDSRDQVKVLNVSEDINLGGVDGGTFDITRNTRTDTFGPQSLPFWVLELTYGGDEETIQDVVILTIQGEEGFDVETVKKAAFTTMNDGPNSVYTSDYGRPTLQKWNSKTKKYDNL